MATSLKALAKQMDEAEKNKKLFKQRKYESEWYNLRPILGCAN